MCAGALVDLGEPTTVNRQHGYYLRIAICDLYTQKPSGLTFTGGTDSTREPPPTVASDRSNSTRHLNIQIVTKGGGDVYALLGIVRYPHPHNVVIRQVGAIRFRSLLTDQPIALETWLDSLWLRSLFSLAQDGIRIIWAIHGSVFCLIADQMSAHVASNHDGSIRMLSGLPSATEYHSAQLPHLKFCVFLHSSPLRPDVSVKGRNRQ